MCFAWLMDRLKAERERGITIDIETRKIDLTDNNLVLTVTDVPGHRDFINNMIRGTANADSAIHMVSASEEELELAFSPEGQTREHALLAFTMGVKQMTVCINKMDRVDWGEARYN